MIFYLLFWGSIPIVIAIVVILAPILITKFEPGLDPVATTMAISILILSIYVLVYLVKQALI